MHQLNRFIVVAAIAAPVPLSAAPSFDCTKATTAIEKAICSDAHLAALDKTLSTTYKQALTQGTPAERHDLLVSQRTWLKSLSVICRDGPNLQGWPNLNSCIEFQYDSRLDDLATRASQFAAGDTEVLFNGNLTVVYTDDPAQGPSYFNDDLKTKKIDGHLIACTMVVSIPLTPYETGQGGACTLQETTGRRKTVLVCNDTGVGRFKLADLHTTIAKHDLAQFTADNCTGG